MSKRQLNTEVIKETWFRKLSANHKLTWIYMNLTCNIAGIWRVDLDKLKFDLGIKIDAGKILEELKSKIHPLVAGESEYWCLVGYIRENYGELSLKCNTHKGVIKILKKFNLIDDNLTLSEGLVKGSLSLINNSSFFYSSNSNSTSNSSINSSINSTIVNKNTKVINKKQEKNKIPPKLESVIAYFEFKEHLNPKEGALEYFDYFQSNGWMSGRNKIKDWQSAANNWIRKDYSGLNKVNDEEASFKERMIKQFES